MAKTGEDFPRSTGLAIPSALHLGVDANTVPLRGCLELLGTPGTSRLLGGFAYSNSWRENPLNMDNLGMPPFSV